MRRANCCKDIVGAHASSQVFFRTFHIRDLGVGVCLLLDRSTGHFVFWLFVFAAAFYMYVSWWTEHKEVIIFFVVPRGMLFLFLIGFFVLNSGPLTTYLLLVVRAVRVVRHCCQVIAMDGRCMVILFGSHFAISRQQQNLNRPCCIEQLFFLIRHDDCCFVVLCRKAYGGCPMFFSRKRKKSSQERPAI